MAQAEPEPPREYRYLCDASTWARNMEAVEALQIVALMLGGPVSVALETEAWERLPADVRRHFRRVVAP